MFPCLPPVTPWLSSVQPYRVPPQTGSYADDLVGKGLDLVLASKSPDLDFKLFSVSCSLLRYFSDGLTQGEGKGKSGL